MLTRAQPNQSLKPPLQSVCAQSFEKNKHNISYERAFLSKKFIHHAKTFARSLVPVR